MGAKSFCWPKGTVVRVLRDFVTLIESEKAMAAEAAAIAASHAGSEELYYTDRLDDLTSSWQLDNRLAHARFLLSAPVGEDVDDWLEAEMADVVYWRHGRRPAPVRDAGRLDEPPGCTDPALACVSRATFLRLMRDLEMLVVSVHRVGRDMAELPPAEAAALLAEFCRDWRVFELLAEDAAILSRALGGAVERALDDLPVWDAEHPQPPLAVFASERDRQISSLIG